MRRSRCADRPILHGAAPRCASWSAASNLSELLFDAAIRDETDPGLKAQIAAVAQGAALNSSDPAKRIAAIGRIAANPDRGR